MFTFDEDISFTLLIQQLFNIFFSLSKVLASGPEITNIMTSATAVEVIWINLKRNDSNGNITHYEVCYQRGSGVPNCTWSKNVTSVKNTTTTLRGLRPATNYTVAVRAYTSSGPENLGKEKTVTTNESGELLKYVIKDLRSKIFILLPLIMIR